MGSPLEGSLLGGRGGEPWAALQKQSQGVLGLRVMSHSQVQVCLRTGQWGGRGTLAEPGTWHAQPEGRVLSPEVPSWTEAGARPVRTEGLLDDPSGLPSGRQPAPATGAGPPGERPPLP